jgi:hypothetical protein
MPLTRYVARVGTYAHGAMKNPKPNETKYERERL